MKLHFKKFGAGDPILILHGLFGISDNWITIAKSLAKNYLVYVLDMRNHGRSPHTEAFTYTDMVEDVYEFLTDLNLRQVSMIGHSMGGKTAMSFALEYPHRLNKLIIIDISPRKYPIFHKNIIEGLLALDINKLNSRKDADIQLTEKIASRRIRQFLLKNLARNDDGSLTWRINLPVIAENLSEIGAEIKSKSLFSNPTLFLRGGKSEYIGESDFQIIQDQFTNSEIITIPGTSHWIHSEAPEEVFKVIDAFL
jgi:pimeloyl-ACP methyl ester carboxylesterase